MFNDMEMKMDILTLVLLFHTFFCGSGNNFYRIWFPDLGEDSLCDDADYYRCEFTLVENLPTSFTPFFKSLR